VKPALLRSLPGWAVLLLWTVVVILPLYALFVSCFKSTAQIYASPLALPPQWSLDNFISAWTQLNLGQNLLNSLMVTVGAVLITIVVSAMAAFPLSRYDLNWGPWMLLLFLAGIMLPIRLASVELFNVMKHLNLIDSLWGLVFVYVAIRIPFAVFIFVNFMRTLPRELEEAARIDGAGEVRILFQVILPVVVPAVAIVAIFTSVAVWNDFFFPLIFIFSDENKTIPLAIAGFIGQYRTDWGTIFASLGISLAPVLAMYLILARQIREGVGSTGAIK
jgi:raffinose/stachyose/melibiose transport system permease protein